MKNADKNEKQARYKSEKATDKRGTKMKTKHATKATDKLHKLSVVATDFGGQARPSRPPIPQIRMVLTRAPFLGKLRKLQRARRRPRRFLVYTWHVSQNQSFPEFRVASLSPHTRQAPR